MSKARVLRVGHCAFVAAGAVALFVLGLCGVVAVSAADPALPHVGSRPEVLAQVSAGPPDFRFAVLGDTQKGLASFERLASAVAKEKVDFAVHTGDLVSHNDEGHYLLARRALASCALQVPTVIVPGNHDIKGGSGRFETRFGPREVTFGRGRVHFIVLDNALGDRWNRAWLENELQAAAGKKTVVFMHVPPFDPAEQHFVPRPDWVEIVELIRRHRPAYVFCGHAHGYARIEDQGTIWIANGVGGDSESWQRAAAFATIVEVDAVGLRDRPVEVEPATSLWTEFEHWAIGHVAEAYRAWPVWLAAATAAFAWLWGWATLRLRPRRPKAPRG